MHWLLRYCLIFLAVIHWNCKRDNLQTLIEAKITDAQTRKPIKNVPILVKEAVHDKDSRRFYSYRLDTFYTDDKGEVSFFYNASEKSGHSYTVEIIEGDSNAPWLPHNDEVIQPGFPKFLDLSLDGPMNAYVRIRHDSLKSTDGFHFYAIATDLPGARWLKYDYNIPKGSEVLLKLRALKRHALTISYNYEMWDGSKYITFNGYSKYFMDPKMPQSIPVISY